MLVDGVPTRSFSRRNSSYYVIKIKRRRPSVRTDVAAGIILVGGTGAILPDRRHEIVALGPGSILSGTIATLMSGAVVGLL